MRAYEIERRVPTWDELPEFLNGFSEEEIYKTYSFSAFTQAIFDGDYVDLICKTDDYRYLVYSKHSYDDKWLVECNSLAGAYYWFYDSGEYTSELMELEEQDANKFALCPECWSVYLRDEGCECKEK